MSVTILCAVSLRVVCVAQAIAVNDSSHCMLLQPPAAPCTVPQQSRPSLKTRGWCNRLHNRRAFAERLCCCALWFNRLLGTPSASASGTHRLMSSASRSRLIAVAALSLALVALLLLAGISNAPRSMLAPADSSPAIRRPAAAALPQALHLPLHPAAATSSHPLAQITTHSLAMAQAEEIGGSASATPEDVPVQAYVNKIERLRALRAAKLRARYPRSLGAASRRAASNCNTWLQAPSSRARFVYGRN
jgi:hypothetical protein